MTQQATTTIQQAANGGQVATQRKPVDILKSMMNAEKRTRNNSKMRLVKIRQHS